MFNASDQDLHRALKIEEIAQSNEKGVEFKLIRLQNSKDASLFSLHANPTRFTSSGIQITDYFRYLGFSRYSCNFTSTGECYSRQVKSDFGLIGFATGFADSFSLVEASEDELEACAFTLNHPEGFGYFFGKHSSGQSYRRSAVADGEGDGHTTSHKEQRGTSEDAYFKFALTYIRTGSVREGGWVFHYRPKHPPDSPEMHAALKFLGLKSFDRCPEFDFEPCSWRFIPILWDQTDVFSRNADYVRNGFAQHETRFSIAIEKLLEAQKLMTPFQMYFLEIERQATLPRASVSLPQIDSASRRASPQTNEKGKGEFKFDVALSFAGEQRGIAEQLAKIIRKGGYEVFYDYYYPEQLWGTDLPAYFENVYQKQARFAVMFVSEEYVNKMWTEFERQNIIQRMMKEKGKAYVLPIRVDNSEVPALPSSIGYLDTNKYTIEQIGEILLNKLKGS